MKKAASLILAAVLCLGLCACKEDAPPPVEESKPPEQTVTPAPLEVKEFTLSYDPTASLHPISGNSQVNSLLIPLVYETLFALDEHFIPHPVLAAEAAVNDTGLVWTITPAEGIVFSDGTPLEASHITSSLNTARKSTLYSSRLAGIASVRTSRGKVVITLSEPNGALPALLDIPIVLEQKDAVAPLGTGRYHYIWDEEIPSLKTDRTDLPYETIKLHPVSSTDQRLSAFDCGDVSAVLHDYFSPYALGYSCDYEPTDYATTDMVYVGFNAAKGACNDPLVRRAFAKAFDRTDIVKNLLAGHGTPSSLPIFPGHNEWSEENELLLSFDADAAAALLTEAGYVKKDDGLLYKGRSKNPLTVTLLVNSNGIAKTAIAESLAQSLIELGVTVTVNSLPWSSYTTALSKGNFDLYIGEVQLTGDFTPTALLSGKLNYGGYDVTPMAEALAAWKTAYGTNRPQTADQFMKLFAAEVPFAPLYFGHETVLVRWKSVHNLSPLRSDPFHGMENWIIK